MDIKKRITIISPLALLIFIFSFCPLAGGKSCIIKIINARKKLVTLSAEIADTETLRMKGLMNRKEMDRNAGMLFVFDSEHLLNFWMKDTHIPLSIAYIAGDGTINEIHDMKPLDTSVTYPSSRPARFALEVHKGWFEKNSITRGCRILLNGCVGK